MAALKVFIAPSGFFESIVAAPSQKAAIAALGLADNAFQHGFAKQIREPAIVAAAIAKPGIVLNRPIGTAGKFLEQADLPAIEKLPRIGRTGSTGAFGPKKPLKADLARTKREALLAAEKQRKAKKFAIAERKHNAILQNLKNERQRLEDLIEREHNRWHREKDRLDH